MKEQLEWLYNNMPKGWFILTTPLTLMNITNPNDVEKYQLTPNGDIGFAPLTALLKQEIKEFKITKEYDPYGEVYFLAEFLDMDTLSMFNTEFEAVLSAYKTILEDKISHQKDEI
jgi:hypothetical protein